MSRFKAVFIRCDDCGEEEMFYEDSYKRAEKQLTMEQRLDRDGTWYITSSTHLCPDCKEEDR